MSVRGKPDKFARFHLDKFKKQIKTLGLYLAGKTEREIAEELDIAQDTVRQHLNGNGNISEIVQILNEKKPDQETKQKQAVIREYLGAHLLDPSKPPPSLKVYDVWDFSQCDDHYGSQFPGRIPGQIIENLLGYYTEPFNKIFLLVNHQSIMVQLGKG